MHNKPKDWDQHLQVALRAYRISFETSLGYTPFHLVFGKEALLPIEVQLSSLRFLASGESSQKEQLEQHSLDLERLELDKAEATNRYIAQAKHWQEKLNEGLLPKRIKKGMLVLHYDNLFDNKKDKKFLTKWEGPFQVVKWYENGSYKLHDVDDKIYKTRVNGWRLKPYFLRFEAGATNSSDQEDEGVPIPSKQNWE